MAILKQLIGTYDNYCMEQNSDKAKNIFVLMTNINAVEIKVPNINKKQSIKIADTVSKQKYGEGCYQVKNVESGKALVYVYTNEWISKYKNKNVNLIPEIYIVPWKDNCVSVMFTGQGYIIRDGLNSGFRMENKITIKEYLVGKEYSLYNMSNNKMRKSWKKVEFLELVKEIKIK